MIECPYLLLARRAILDVLTRQLSVVDVVDGLEFGNVHEFRLNEGKHGSLLVPLNPEVQMIISVRRSAETKPGWYPLELAAHLPDGAEGMERHPISADLTDGEVTRVQVTLKSMALREEGVYSFSVRDPETDSVLQSASMVVHIGDQEPEGQNP